MGTKLRPPSDICIPVKAASVAIQTHPGELPSRDFKTLLKMISDYEGETLPLKTESEVECVSVHNTFTEVYDNCRYTADAAVQTDKLKELEDTRKANVSTQACLDENNSLKKTLQEVGTTTDAITTASIQVQTMQAAAAILEMFDNTAAALPDSILQLRKSESLARQLEKFKREMQHLCSVMKCEQHILDLRFSILEHRHEITDDRVVGILKYIPESMTNVKHRSKKQATIYMALKHIIREAILGSLLVAILTFSSIYSVLMNIIKYNSTN